MTDWLCGDDLAPSTAGALEPLFEAAARGELAMPFCAACGAVLELEQVVCDACGGGVTWRTVERCGSVHASTLVHRLEPGLLRATAPYPVLDVELASGHRLVMTTLVATSDLPAVGAPVTVGFRTIGGVAVPGAGT